MNPGLRELIAQLQDGKPNSISFEFNEHWAVYQPVAESDAITDHRNWFVSEEDKRLCIETDSVWEVRWYVNTPVSCVVIYASSLELAITTLLEHKQRLAFMYDLS